MHNEDQTERVPPELYLQVRDWLLANDPDRKAIPDHPRRPLKQRFRAAQGLCQALASATGDSIAMVDSILWLSCHKKVLIVSPEAGPVEFHPHDRVSRHRVIYDGEEQS